MVIEVPLPTIDLCNGKDQAILSLFSSITSLQPSLQLTLASGGGGGGGWGIANSKPTDSPSHPDRELQHRDPNLVPRLKKPNKHNHSRPTTSTKDPRHLQDSPSNRRGETETHRNNPFVPIGTTPYLSQTDLQKKRKHEQDHQLGYTLPARLYLTS